MKSFHHLLINTFIFIIAFSSCTVEKRVYMSGYNIEWKYSSHNKRQNTNDVADKNKIINHACADSNNTLVSKTEAPAEIIHLENTSASANENQILLNEKSDFITASNSINRKQKVKLLKSVFQQVIQFNKFNPGTNPDSKTAQKDGFAIASFISSILGFLLFIISGWPFMLGTLGLIFGIVSLARIKKSHSSGKGLAIAGIVIGIVDIILFWILVALIIAAFNIIY